MNNSIDTELPHYVQTYNLAKVDDPNSQMEGIHFHFIELSKFMKTGTFDLKNPLQAWMKFFIVENFQVTEEVVAKISDVISNSTLL